jgi:transcriptional regulator with XRE-family HTH domain
MLCSVRVDGDRLKERRTTAGLSIRELAELAEISPAVVFSLESKRRNNAHLRTVQKIAAVLAIDVLELSQRED